MLLVPLRAVCSRVSAALEVVTGLGGVWPAAGSSSAKSAAAVAVAVAVA
jgi:hypothetical protein